MSSGARGSCQQGAASRILAAYGYGGNGITFGFLAAELIAGVIGGRRAAWYDDFPVSRPLPRALR